MGGGLMAGDGGGHNRPNRRVCDGGGLMAGDGHNRLNMPNRRVG